MGSSGCGNDGMKEQDRLLPIANVGRIMKQSLPPNAKVSKESRETMQECVSEFISFVTSEAADRCRKEKRKTVNGDDICWAISTLGLDDYAEPLKRYLSKYRELEGDKANQHMGTSSYHADEDSTSAFGSGGRPMVPTPLDFNIFGNGGTINQGSNSRPK
ncbi:hypothetical protein MKW94_008948 [Papaver nudicaule]|uniref:Transcription factor CBF/NF-Y/archaeal histone domain-containing protein n=1 Tax=Papaver nudicaule TaxID=74823 RepID=A0AA41VEX7_PAPNU|nr:hypothetical protein [Papaver nudicaule]MCL7048867.1 hypothetical protein [Papaver nudicaule]